MDEENEIPGYNFNETSMPSCDDLTSVTRLSPPRECSHVEEAILILKVGSWSGSESITPPPRPPWNDTDVPSTVARDSANHDCQSCPYTSSSPGDVDEHSLSRDHIDQYYWNDTHTSQAFNQPSTPTISRDQLVRTKGTCTGLKSTDITTLDSFPSPSTATLDWGATGQHSSQVGSGAFDYMASVPSVTTWFYTPETIPGEDQGMDEFNPGSSSIEPFRLSLETSHQPRPAIGSHQSKLQCKICGKGYSRLDSLKRHEKELHVGDAGVHTCPNPGCKRSKYGFKRNDRLKNLLKSCKS